MPKRFTDTEKFNDPWYRRLTILQKVIWEYLLAECNHAGILEKLDLDLMTFKIGEQITIENLKTFDNRIVFINEETLFIPKFIKFQYGELNPKNKVHASILKEFKKWDIQAPFKPLSSPLLGSKDKDKDIYTTNIYKDSNISNNIINEKNSKKIDPYLNPINQVFSDEYQKVFNTKPYLMNNQRNKLTELAAEIENFSDTIPAVLNKLKNVEFSLPNFTANYIWLLTEDNYIKVLSGTYDKKPDPWEEYCRAKGRDEYGN